MSPYDMIKAQMGSAVPFASHAGVTLTNVADGTGTAELEQTGTSVNHIGSQHAGALFTLGEAASGAAMAGAFLPVLMSVRPVAANANIMYKRIAKGTITADAKTSKSGAELLQSLEKDGKVLFNVLVTLKDTSDTIVAEMTVAWHVSKA